MICPHCNTTVNYDWERTKGLKSPAQDWEDPVIQIINFSFCPSCYEMVIVLSVEETDEGYKISNTQIYPPKSAILDSEYIPEIYIEDYNEAINVLHISPKSSAALSRRLLQTILREKYGIEHHSLYKEITEFLELDGIPSYIADAVDAIRNIGNFAAHPLKDTNTGLILPVEKGEAEWLLEVIEALFDFSFIQPIKLEQRRNQLNEKLEKLGKPPMK